MFILILNIDDAEQLASQYRIEAIPALLFFQNGEVVDRVSGLVSQKVLAEKVKSLSDRQVA